MKVLRELLGEVWRVWTRSDLAVDPLQQVIQLVNSGASDKALAHARALRADEIPWEKLAKALESYGKEVEPLLYLALRQTGDRPHALLALGHWLAANNEPLRAYLCAEEAHRLLPEEPTPLILMGWLHLTFGNPHCAGQHFLAALRRDEGHQEAWHGYRIALQNARGVLPPPADMPEDAEIRLRAAVAANPADHVAPLELGKHYAITSRCMLALPHLRTACELAPRAREPAYWLAWSLARLSDYEAALDVASAALELVPDDAEMLKLAADCAIHCGQEARASDWLNHVRAQRPEDAEVFANLGLCLNHLERFDESSALLAQALALDPALTEARHNLAYALHCLGRYAEARTHLDILLETEKNDFSARWYRSTTLLAAHDFAEGWRDYEFRFVASAVGARLIPLPAWQGEPLAGKKIVVVAEQGIGDEIMFASCLPDLLRQAGHVVIECNRRLVKLFQRSFPQASIVEWTDVTLPAWLAQHHDADYHVFGGSLPLHMRTSIASYRGHPPYLVPAAPRTVLLRQRIDALGPGLKVGIAWRGGGNASRTRTRSLDLPQLLPLFAMPGCRFVSVQYGDCAAEVAAFREQHGISVAHWPEILGDLDDFASLVAALDIIVTVCSAPVHFAGAQGKPALVLTPFAPEWRYRGIDDRMLWYRSVRLFPQGRLDDWDAAIRRVADSVAEAARPHDAD